MCEKELRRSCRGQRTCALREVQLTLRDRRPRYGDATPRVIGPAGLRARMRQLALEFGHRELALRL